MTHVEKPLAGVKVLDLTQAYSGPFATMHLTDHSTQIIKVAFLVAHNKFKTLPWQEKKVILDFCGIFKK